MERVYIGEIREHLEKEVLIQGFVDSFRDSKHMAFIVVKDITGRVQITVEKSKLEHLLPEIAKITQDSVISAVGTCYNSEYVKLNNLEFIPSSIKVESVAEALPIHREDIPASKNKAAVVKSSIDERMDYRWIDLRTDRNQLIFKIQTTMVNAMREFLLDRHFLEIHSPKLIAAASETGADVFEVKYFDREAYLAQSPQFYKQMAMAAGFDRIFETGPVFRAEKSYTSKHTTEFTGFDLEFSYVNSEYDVMKMEEDLLVYALKKVHEKHAQDIVNHFGIELIVPTSPFPVIKLRDLYDELKKEFGYEVDEEEKVDLTTEAEKLSYEWVRKVHGHEFLFVTDFGKEKRAFYHMRNENGIPMGYDLIWRGVEITTGAMREHRYDKLVEQAKEKGLETDVKFYLDFFKYGCPPHGGFGVGVDRMTMLILGLHINEAMFLFRSPKRLEP